MKWAYSIKQKTKAAMLLALVLVAVLGKNLLDSKNVKDLGNSFAAVYEDRLLVESYIFQLSGHMYQKKMTLDNCARGEDLSLVQDKLKGNNAAIVGLLQAYEKTQLTPKEEEHFTALKQDMTQIQKLETQYLRQHAMGPEVLLAKTQLDAHYGNAADHLDQLSHIQVAEGKRLNELSKQIMAGSAILTQFEIVLLIGIGVMIQMLVFASKSQFSKIKQKPMLN